MLRLNVDQQKERRQYSTTANEPEFPKWGQSGHARWLKKV